MFPFCFAFPFPTDQPNPTYPHPTKHTHTNDETHRSLSYSLFIIFFSQIVVNNIQEVGIPYITAKVKALLDLRAHANLLKAGVEKGLDDVKVGVEAVGGAVGDVVGLHHESSKVLDDEEKEDIEIDMEDSKVRQRMKSPLEMQLFLKEYDTPFDDYLEIALQFGEFFTMPFDLICCCKPQTPLDWTH